MSEPKDSRELLFSYMKYFGRLYDFDSEGIDDMTRLQDLLDIYEGHNESGSFDFASHMKNVSEKSLTNIVL